MQVTTIISDIAGVLLRHDPNWNEDTQWEAQLGLKKGSLSQALFHPERDKAALLGHLSQREVLRIARKFCRFVPERFATGQAGVMRPMRPYRGQHMECFHVPIALWDYCG